MGEIIKGVIMKLAEWVIGLFEGFLSFPMFPPQVGQVFDFVVTWMVAGMGIVDFFVPMDEVAPALAMFMVVFALQKGYYLIMWVLNKIPALGID